MNFYEQTKKDYEDRLIIKKRELRDFRERLADIEESLVNVDSIPHLVKDILNDYSEVKAFDIQSLLEDFSNAWQRYKLLRMKISLCQDEIYDLKTGIEELVKVFLKHE